MANSTVCQSKWKPIVEPRRAKPKKYRTQEKRKPINPNKHKSNKRTKSTKISSLFPKRGNRNTKRTEKHKNKMTHGKTYNKSPRRINHKATKSKTKQLRVSLVFLEIRELILVIFVRLFGLCLFRFVGFLFLLGSGKGCGLWLWHSLDFSLTFFGVSFQGVPEFFCHSHQKNLGVCEILVLGNPLLKSERCLWRLSSSHLHFLNCVPVHLNDYRDRWRMLTSCCLVSLAPSCLVVVIQAECAGWVADNKHVICPTVCTTHSFSHSDISATW